MIIASLSDVVSKQILCSYVFFHTFLVEWSDSERTSTVFSFTEIKVELERYSWMSSSESCLPNLSFCQIVFRSGSPVTEAETERQKNSLSTESCYCPCSLLHRGCSRLRISSWCEWIACGRSWPLYRRGSDDELGVFLAKIIVLYIERVESLSAVSSGYD